eukprot:gene8056-9603_t
MPRNKAVPVKRGVDRFHHSTDRVEDYVELEDDELENNDVDLGTAEGGSEVLVEVNEQQQDVEWEKLLDTLIMDNSVRIDWSGDPPNTIGEKWLRFGSKYVSDVSCCLTAACNEEKPCHHLYLDDSNNLLIVCGQCLNARCASALQRQHHKLGPHIRSALQAETLQIQLQTTANLPNSVNVELHIYIHRTATTISPVLLNWILLNNTMRPDWYNNTLTKSNSISSQFSAGDFLSEISNQYSMQKDSIQFNHAQLAMVLLEAGVSTELRSYQLDGVQWMARRLFMSANCRTQSQAKVESNSVDNSCSGGAGQTTFLGWLPLPISSTHSTLWYNTFTDQLYTGSSPPDLFNSSTDTVIGGVNSVILADEMGVGKSLQILSLILAMNNTNLKTTSSPDRSASAYTECNSNIVSASASSGSVIDLTQSLVPADSTVDTKYNTTKSNTHDSNTHAPVESPPLSSSRSCLCGSSSECKDKVLRSLGWIQCNTCHTWLHGHCAGFTNFDSIQNMVNQEYTCLSCSCLKHYTLPVAAKTTLIVMPNTLIHQWKAEMLKHLKNVTFDDPYTESGLKVFLYPEDIGKNKHENFARLDPRTLALYDIILISFKSLQKGFHDSNVDYTSERILHSTYAIYPPPFLCVHYQLVVVDETQNIESTTTSQILTMCCKIASTYRICVSGTPFGSGRLSDLHSLCKFLRLEPFHSHPSAWHSIIESPALHSKASSRIQWLYEMFQRVTLRRTKAMVQEQLGLPEHAVITKPLVFSTFERALYEEKLLQYRTSLLSTIRNIPHYATNASNNNSTNNIATLLLDTADAKAKLELLRKGCCHPQVLDRTLAKTRNTNHTTSSAHSNTVNSITAGPRPLDEIMVIKVEQTRLLCEEHQRGLLFHLFALAATAACQVQCGVLGVGEYASFPHYDTSSSSSNSNGDANTAVLTSLSAGGDTSPMHYLLRSFLAYTLALKIIRTNRQPTVLIAMCKIGGERLYINDTCVTLYPGGRKLVPHAHDGLDVKWDLSDQFRIVSSDVTSTPIRSDSVVWLAAPNAPNGVVTSPALPVLFSALSSITAPLQAQLMFANGRRLTDMVVTSDVQALYRKFYIQQLHLHNTNHYKLFEHTSSSSNTEHSSTKYEVLLFPACVELQVSTGLSDVYSNILSVNVPAPYTNGTTTTINDTVTPGILTSQRSKKYQLHVTSVQSHCLVLRAVHTTTGVLVTHTYMEVQRLTDFCTSVYSGKTDGARVGMKVRVCANVTLLEACFDTDALQELHVCHNINRLSSILPEQYQPVLNTCLSNILSIRMLPSTSSNVTLCVKHLQPKATTLPYTTAIGKVRTGDSNNGSDLGVSNNVVDNNELTHKNNAATYCEQFLTSTTARETQIENEFLEAASSRRLLASAHLSEIKDQLQELEGEVCTLITGTEGRNSKTPITIVPSVPSAQRMWWNQLLLLLEQDMHFQASLQSCIDQGEAAYRKLANFSSMHGLQYILGKEYDSMEAARSKALKVLAGLSAQPTSHEILESSNCHQCRAYFQKTGPVCAHCKKQAALNEYSSFLLCYRRQNKRVIATSSAAVAQSPSKKAKAAQKGKNTTKNGANKNNIHVLGGRDDLFDTHEEVSFEVRKMDEGVVDGVLLMVLRQLKAHAGKSQYTNSYDNSTDSDGDDSPTVFFKDLCALEIKRQEQLKAEYHSMVSLWDRYSDLLKAYDELEQCKTRTSLNLSSVNNSTSKGSCKKNTSGDSSGADTSDTESTAQLHPYELSTSIQATYASALESEYELQKCMNSLTFYKEQVKEIFTVHDDASDPFYPIKAPISSGYAGADPNSILMQDCTVPSTTTSNTTVKQPAIPSSPVKIAVPTCLICQENLRTITAHTPSKHNHPSTNANPDTALEVVLLPCAHRFHRDCVTRWPVANNSTSDNSTHPINSTIQPLTSTAKVTSPPSTNTNAHIRTRLKGMWGTKVDTLVLDLLDLCEDPERLTEKAIVFSQWVEMIDIVGEAFRSNNIPHVKCINRNKDFTGTGSLQSFRTDSTVRVLLMPLALGAEGLDLIVASHVFLLEPLLNTHQELQAVNRISRLGQDKKTYVHKYVVQNTIEENIVVVQQRTHNNTITIASNTASAAIASTTSTPTKTNKRSSSGKHGDDDLLSQEDLLFILGLDAASNAGTTDNSAVDLIADESLNNVMPSTGRPLHTIHEIDSEEGENIDVDGDNSVNGDGEDRMEEGEGEDEEFGSPTRLMNHFG